MTKEIAINTLIKGNDVDANKISDGYHTFGELYEHRISLYITLLRHVHNHYLKTQGTSPVWKSEVHSDGKVWEGWFILGIYSQPGEQITYHLPISKWDECDFAKVVNQAPEWDGHTSEDVLERIKNIL